MIQQETAGRSELRELAAEIVAAYVANNSVSITALPELVGSVFAALDNLGTPESAPVPDRPTPPVSVKNSLTDEYLISMEDGRRYKTLRRHLGRRGLTPDQYREKWGLPRDYPMVAPSYGRRRSELAKAAGLGRSRRAVRENSGISAALPKAGASPTNQPDAAVGEKPQRSRRARASAGPKGSDPTGEREIRESSEASTA